MQKNGPEQNFVYRARETAAKPVKFIKDTGNFLLGLVSPKWYAQRERRQFEASRQEQKNQEQKLSMLVAKIKANRVVAEYSAYGEIDDDTAKEYFLSAPGHKIEELNMDSVAEEILNSDELQALRGRIIGRHILQLLSEGKSLDFKDETGKITGNWQDEFNSIPTSISFDQMGFSTQEIAWLEDKPQPNNETT